MLHLPAEPAGVVANDGDRKAAFAVGEPDDPLPGIWSFLLIDRTGWIVTSAHVRTLRMVCDINGEYHRIHGVSSIWSAALCGIAPARGRPFAREGRSTLGIVVTSQVDGETNAVEV